MNFSMDDIDQVQLRKKYTRVIKKARERSKPDSCILCGKEKTSFCNSHSVPSMVLRNIAQDGKLLYVNSLIGFEMIDSEKGVNNSGTFHIICKDCDNTFFQDYENLDSLLSKPTDIMLAEIALKNTLLQYSKRLLEIELFKELQNEVGMFDNYEALNHLQKLDLRDYSEEIAFYKGLIDNNNSGGFQILFWEKLPYKTPIAIQSCIALPKDMENNIVNDIYDMSYKVRMEDMHLCVFPLEKETVVLAFYHKRDRKYRKLRHQFNSVSEERIIKYINWLIIKYTENYYISKEIEDILADKNLKELSQDNNDLPSLGMVNLETLLKGYKGIGVDEIPNLLSSEFAII